MSTYILALKNEPDDVLDKVKQIAGVDPNTVARTFDNIIQLEWSEIEDDLHKELAKLFGGGIFITKVDGMTMIP